MNVNVSPVRLVFNVHSITAVAVSSNWLYLTGGPTTVVRINLDSPSHVEDIQLPRKYVGSGDFIKYMFTDSTGHSLLAVTAKREHFFYSDAKQNFKHLGKLRGTTTISAAFLNPHWLLMGTEAGNLVEVGIDSSANETYFKRELRLASHVWKSPTKDPVTGVLISKNEVTIACGPEILRWKSGTTAANATTTSLSVSELGDSVFKPLFALEPEIIFSSPHSIRQLVQSPDKKVLAAVVGSRKIAFCRSAGKWVDVKLSNLKYLIASNYYLLAIHRNNDNNATKSNANRSNANHDDDHDDHDDNNNVNDDDDDDNNKNDNDNKASTLAGASMDLVSAINVFTQEIVEIVPVSTTQSIRGVSVDPIEDTFWLFSNTDLLEIKISNEDAGVWKVLADRNRFEEALEVVHTKSARAYVLKQYGLHELGAGNAKHGAKLLGSSDIPLEVAASEVMKHDSAATTDLLSSRLAITKSKAQQIMLTSWLALLGDYSFLEKSQYAWDSSTILQVLKEQGDFDRYLAVAINIGDIKAAVSYHIIAEQWSEALELLRQYEPAELVYDYASVLLNNAPQHTVESWMRMPNLNASKLLPSLISYSSEYRGPLEANQALRYVKHILHSNHTPTKFSKAAAAAALASSSPSSGSAIAIFNAMVSMLSMHASDEQVLEFLKEYAADYSEHEFALRMCLKQQHYQSAVFLYTLMGLYEDAVQVCLDIATPEMYNTAIDIASNQTVAGTQGNEELRKYLLRLIAQHVIKSQGPSAAMRFTRLLRVDDLLSQFPDFDTLSDLAPEIVKSLEQTNNRLSSLNLEIDETLESSEKMQQELAGFKRRSVLVEPGEPCFLCEFPLVTRKFVVFPCQHGFHMDCIRRKLDEFGSKKEVTEECVLCSNISLQQIDEPLTADF